jgi:serine/threonine protein kinase
METNALPIDPQGPLDRNASDSTLSATGPGGATGGQIGPYRLLQVLGEGGMGEVWLAEQKTPMHRTVALKLIKAGMDTKTVMARFESERQALALMDHPNIAQVYDAGSTPEGRPYFVMEYVPGVPITEYCDRHRLTMKERLELFMQVCDGVQHAHQKAIIHRDLKPSNVLVVEQDAKAVAKIIDFGLAKAVAQRLTDKTFFTEMGVLVGTPEYMSPEQADLREQNVDTRTDVYSLGVILYELLVGALPFDAKTLRAAGLEAILRVIREQEPPKPSTKVRMMGDSSMASAEKRKEEPRSLARHLQGELDWITLKALEKERARRYGTASELAADLARYLRNEPVVAGPATAAYRMRKYAARHRFGLGAAAAVVVLLAGFAVAQAVELRRVRLERDRADRERDRANRIAEFMTRMFKVSDPSEARGNNITAREILDKASTDIDTSLTRDPELQAQLMSTMAAVYDNLGLYPRAQALDQRAVEIRRAALGPEHPDTLRSMHNLADVLDEEGHYAEAGKLYRETFVVSNRVLGAEDRETLRLRIGLADVLIHEGHYADAEKLNRETLDIDRRVLGPAHRDTLGTMSNLARDLQAEGRYDEAEELNREALEIRRRTLGPAHPDTLDSMANLANVLGHKGGLAEAEKLYRENFEVRRRIQGPEHPATLIAMGNVALVEEREGHLPEAEKLYRQAFEIQRRVLGPEHPNTLLSMNNLAGILDEERRHAEAEELYRQTLDIKRRVLGPEHPDTLLTMTSLILVLDTEHRYAEAEKLDREALAIERRVHGPRDPNTALATYNLACLVAQQGRKDEALSLLHAAVDNGLPPSVDSGIEKDTDLNSLHRTPDFAQLVAHAKEVAAAAQKPK